MLVDIWGLLGFSAPGGVLTVLTFHLAILLPFKKAPQIEPACKLQAVNEAQPCQLQAVNNPYSFIQKTPSPLFIAAHTQTHHPNPHIESQWPTRASHPPSPIRKKHDLPTDQSYSTIIILFMA